MNRSKILKFWVLWVKRFYGCAALNPRFSAHLAARVEWQFITCAHAPSLMQTIIRSHLEVK
jgi:hypothetical protein